jgi:hypothetical protein
MTRTARYRCVYDELVRFRPKIPPEESALLTVGRQAIASVTIRLGRFPFPISSSEVYRTRDIILKGDVAIQSSARRFLYLDHFGATKSRSIEKSRPLPVFDRLHFAWLRFVQIGGKGHER